MARRKKLVPDYIWNAEVTKHTDGDTFWVELDLGLRIRIRWRVRLAHVKAPSIKTAAGRAAAVALAALMPLGCRVVVRSRKLEKYERVLGEIQLADGRDLAKTLSDAGHVVPYEGDGPGD